MQQGRPAPAEYEQPLRWWGHAWRVVAMLAISGAVVATAVEQMSPTALVLDVVVGTAAWVLVFLRRRSPLAIVLVLTLLSVVSALAAGPATLAAVSFATRRRWMQIVAVAVLSVASAEAFAALHPPTQAEAWWVTLGSNVVFIAATMAWGMYIGSRRELLWTLRTRAENAEAEQELRAEQSRHTERARIAREMHDVLAHRISQISLHAGALGFRDDLSREQLRAGAGVIQDAAHQALEDLRGVLGVLRDDTTGELLDRPQPTYADLPELVDEARGAGLSVRYEDRLSRDLPMPDVVGRTLFRIIQEGMTNAAKHAPGALLSIDLAGSPDEGVALTLTNPIGFGRTSTPGAGLGLVGLSERTSLRGGRLEHRRDGESFVLRAWIPWAA